MFSRTECLHVDTNAAAAGIIHGISSEYQVPLEKSQGKDKFTLKIEREKNKDSSGDEHIEKNIKSLFKNKIYVTPEVEVVDYGSLPRSVRKTKRVSDLLQIKQTFLAPLHPLRSLLCIVCR
jgi:phenylacetate-coenzyme A ligase PaaK-like adenylate-forming protein